MPITLEIVTPDAKVFSEEVDQVIVPTSNGKIGVLPHHVPVIDKLVAGDLKVIKDGQTEYLDAYSIAPRRRRPRPRAATAAPHNHCAEAEASDRLIRGELCGRCTQRSYVDAD